MCPRERNVSDHVKIGTGAIHAAGRTAFFVLWLRGEAARAAGKELGREKQGRGTGRDAHIPFGGEGDQAETNMNEHGSNSWGVFFFAYQLLPTYLFCVAAQFQLMSWA